MVNLIVMSFLRYYLQLLQTIRSITDSYIETSSVDLRPYINTHAPYDPAVEELRNLRQEVTKLVKLLEK